MYVFFSFLLILEQFVAIGPVSKSLKPFVLYLRYGHALEKILINELIGAYLKTYNSLTYEVFKLKSVKETHLT